MLCSSYLTGSYQCSFVLGLSLITSNTGGVSDSHVVAIWRASTDVAPKAKQEDGC
jgi:hypothetical protein